MGWHQRGAWVASHRWSARRGCSEEAEVWTRSYFMYSLGSLALFFPSHSCPDLFLSLPPSLSFFGRLRRRSTRQVGDDDDDDDDAHDASMERAIALQPLNPSGEGDGPSEV